MFPPESMNNNNGMFPERLKTARLNAGLAQHQLAALVDVGQSHISGMELGRRFPSFETLERLAKVLGVATHWLMGGPSSETLGQTTFGRDHILADRQTPPGLEMLAANDRLCGVLEITSDEWRALRSMEIGQPIDPQGYVTVLMALRGHRLARGARGKPGNED
jgi:transcriptional regulator with XRE-family HTH domain